MSYKKSVPTKQEVEKVLALIKTLNSKDKLYILERTDNEETLRYLNLTINAVKQEINKLSVENYTGGPEEDDNKKLKGDIWKFGKFIQREEIYIKFRITEELVVCISFHIATYKINYIYK